MDKFRVIATGEIIEAVKVPVREPQEADKDLEQRFAKIAAWLIDQDHIKDVDFDHRNEQVSYQLDEWYNHKWMDVGGGQWIYQSARHGVLFVSGDENFFPFFEKIEEQ